MELPYTVLAILFITLVRSNDGTKMSFSFKKTDGGGTLQIVDFHSIKGKVVKDADIYEKDQKLVKDWFECYALCLDLSSECRSFNYKNANGFITCQPSGVMPHLQSAKLDASSYEIWYMPYPEGTATIV